MAGTTVGPRDNERLVAINGIAVDVASHMAFLFYEDRPGVIGRVGTLLRRAASTSPRCRLAGASRAARP